MGIIIRKRLPVPHNRTYRSSFLSIVLLVCLLVTILPVTAQTVPPAPRAQQVRAALAQLERERGRIESIIEPATGTPAYLHGNFVQNARRFPERAARNFVQRYAAAWGIEQQSNSLRLIAQNNDPRGTIMLRFEQRWRDLPVFGTDLRVHIDAAGMLHTINGQLLPDLQPPATQPSLSADAAQKRAAAALGGTIVAAPQLGIARKDDRDVLVWRVILLDQQRPARWIAWIDALDGTVRLAIDTLATARERYTYSANNTAAVPGVLVRSEGQPAVADPVVNAAHDNAGAVYDFYRAVLQRDSIDGAGLPIVSTVHYRRFDDTPYSNAFWNGSQMVYGDGDGVTFAPLAYGLDVTAHELTHGVTQFEQGPGTDEQYRDQPGALNEGFSDVFAVLIDAANWDIGETIYTPDVPGDALRSAADPTRYGDPGVWGEYLSTSLDRGGIHSNSGILLRIAYEIGTTIGRTKTALIFYRTLTQKLTKTSNYLVTRYLTIQACDELIGAADITDQDCADVRMAFQRSGIGQPSAITLPRTLTNRYYLPQVAQGAANAQPRLQPAPLPACGAQLARNGGFEQGLTGWATDAETTTVSDQYPRRSGSRSAQIGAGYQLLQYVRLPAGARTVQITLNVQRAEAVAPTQPTLEIRAAAGDGTPIATLASLNGAQEPGTWQTITAPLDVSTVRDLRLVFADRYGTHTIDDVSMIAACG